VTTCKAVLANRRADQFPNLGNRHDFSGRIQRAGSVIGTC